jgi:predicted PurR-regulated permease PerM
MVMAEMTANQDESGWTLKRYLVIAAAVAFTPILLVFVVGLIIAVVTDPVPTAQRMSSIRDMAIIIVVFEVFMIIVAVVALALQIARLASTVQGEVQPMIDNAREATETVKGTAQFVSKNAVKPIISAGAVLAGVVTFVREISAIRRAIRRNPDKQEIQE